jgi:hypothetical protein
MPEADDAIILYGSKAERKNAHRIIATLDLPRPGINMEMWGIQISSRNPDQMSKVMGEVRKEINQTRQLLQETYEHMQQLARDINWVTHLL